MTTEQQQYIVQLAQNVLGKFNGTYFKHHRWIDALDALAGVSEMQGSYAERARDPQTYDPDYHRSAGQACNWAAAAIMAELRGNSTPGAFWAAADNAARVAAQLASKRAGVQKMLAEFRAIWAPLEPMYPTTGYDECDDGLHVAVSMAANWGEYKADLSFQSWPHEHAIGAASTACVKWTMAYLRGTADEERDARKIAVALVKKARRKYDEDKAVHEAAKEE